MTAAKTDDSESSDSNSSEESENTDAIISLFELGRKRLGLFNNLRNEKVCCVCETAGSRPTVKCKGLCSELYHLDCVKSRVPLHTTEIKESVKNSDTLKEGTDVVDDDSYSNEECVEMKEKHTAKSEATFKLERKDVGDSKSATDDIIVEVEKTEENKTGELDEFCDSDDEPLVSKKESKDEGDASAGKLDLIKASVVGMSQEADFGEEFRCNDCGKGKIPSCFVCRKDKCPETGQEERKSCSVG